MWGSSVPGALTGLTAAITAASNGVAVVKGPAVGGSARKEVVLVGWDGIDDAPAVQMTVGDFDAARRRQLESYDVAGAVLVASGSTSIDPFITRAFVILGYVGAALQADKTLGGVVMDAKLTGWTLDLSQIKDGALVRIPYTVSVLAVTTH